MYHVIQLTFRWSWKRDFSRFSCICTFFLMTNYYQRNSRITCRISFCSLWKLWLLNSLYYFLKIFSLLLPVLHCLVTYTHTKLRRLLLQIIRATNWHVCKELQRGLCYAAFDATAHVSSFSSVCAVNTLLTSATQHKHIWHLLWQVPNDGTILFNSHCLSVLSVPWFFHAGKSFSNYYFPCVIVTCYPHTHIASFKTLRPCLVMLPIFSDRKIFEWLKPPKFYPWNNFPTSISVYCVWYFLLTDYLPMLLSAKCRPRFVLHM